MNSFISVLNVNVEDICPFCTERETVFHCFTECHRLSALFLFLQGVFTVFTKGVFICGFKYTRQKKEKSQLLNFVLGLAKMAVYVSRRRRVEVEGGETISPLTMCVELIRSRVRLDFGFYKMAGDLDTFKEMWCHQNVLCQVMCSCR